MGTSGSYGGSGKQPWIDAQQGTADAFGGGDPTGRPPDQPAPPPPPREEIGDILANVGAGLWSDDPELRPARLPTVSLGSIILGGSRLAGLPSLGTSTGRRGASGTTRSGRGHRPVVSGARRTGAAIGAGYALRSGNSETLAELGLDLAELRRLTVREQTQRIIDQIFGASADENDQAAREASSVVLLDLLMSPAEDTDYTRVIQDGVTEFIYRRAVVEIAAQLNAGAITARESQDRQKQIREYIRDLVRAAPGMQPSTGPPTPAACSQTLAQITAMIVRALRPTGAAA